MPELPDVEVFREYLDATGLHQEIAGLRVPDPGVLDEEKPGGLGRKLNGRALEETRRHGKHLLVRVDRELWLTFHFGMTGGLEYAGRPDGLPEHTALALDFDNGAVLAFTCPRKLGRVGTTPSPEALTEAKELGPDALSVEEEEFGEIFRDKRGFAKTALMDQSALAGVGNVYSDETLFHLGVHPRTKIGTLMEDSAEDLFLTLRGVLTTAVNALAGRIDWPDTYLVPRREPGAECPRCGVELRREDVGGRTAYLCPRRQGEDP